MLVSKVWVYFVHEFKPDLCHLSRPMGKPTICIGENKGADQLRGNREADQHLCFRYSGSTMPPLLNSKISSFYLASVAVQVGLCQSCSETTLSVFPRDGSFLAHRKAVELIGCTCSGIIIIVVDTLQTYSSSKPRGQPNLI